MEAAHDTRRQLGEIMIEAGLITQDELTHALGEQQRLGRPLGTVLVELGYVSQGAVANALAEQHGGLLKTEFGISAGLHVVQGEAPRPKREAAAAPAAAVPDGRVQELEAQLQALIAERTKLLQHVAEVRDFAQRAAEAEQAATARAGELEQAQQLAAARIEGLAAEVERLSQRADDGGAEAVAAAAAEKEDTLLTSLASLEGELGAARAEIAELERQLGERAEAFARLEQAHAAELQELRAAAEAAGVDDPGPAADPEPDAAHFLFVPLPGGYAVVERPGPPPGSGTSLDVNGVSFTVSRVGQAPVPGRDLRCAFLLRD